MEYPIKHITSEMQGAPVINGSYGDLIKLLDACLINGFNVQNGSSIAVTDGIGSITFSGNGHGYVKHQVIQLDNAGAWSGQYRVASVSGATVQIKAPSGAQALNTAFTVKAAPLGFEKAFSGENRAVYRSPNVKSSRLFLRVDHSKPADWGSDRGSFAKVTIARNMSDVDTFIGPRAPFNPGKPSLNEVYDGQNKTNGWFIWPVAMSSAQNSPFTAGSRKWAIVGSDNYFYLSIAYVHEYSGYGIYGFVDSDDGLLIAKEAPENFNMGFSSVESDNGFEYSLSVRGKMSLSANDTVNSKRVFLFGVNPVNGQFISGFSDGITTNGKMDGVIPYTDIHQKTASNEIIGQLPGAYWLLSPVSLSRWQIVAAAENETSLHFVMVGSNQNESKTHILLDLGDL